MLEKGKEWTYTHRRSQWLKDRRGEGYDYRNSWLSYIKVWLILLVHHAAATSKNMTCLFLISSYPKHWNMKLLKITAFQYTLCSPLLYLHAHITKHVGPGDMPVFCIPEVPGCYGSLDTNNFVEFLSPSRHVPIQYHQSDIITSFHIHFNLLFNNHSTIWCSYVWATDSTINYIINILVMVPSRGESKQLSAKQI
jgi:hypothetical protein